MQENECELRVIFRETISKEIYNWILKMRNKLNDKNFGILMMRIIIFTWLVFYRNL